MFFESADDMVIVVARVIIPDAGLNITGPASFTKVTTVTTAVPKLS